MLMLSVSSCCIKTTSTSHKIHLCSAPSSFHHSLLLAEIALDKLTNEFEHPERVPSLVSLPKMRLLMCIDLPNYVLPL